MEKISIEKMNQINGGKADAECLGGILVGLVGGTSAGFRVGRYFSAVGIAWGMAIGGIGGALLGGYRAGCFDR
jgi:hypothetical protein